MSVVDTARTAYDLAKKGMTVEFQQKIMQLREEALELQEENLRLRKENRELREKVELQEMVTRRRRVYWRDGDDDPYCPYCYEERKTLIHLTLFERHNAGRIYNCNHCQTRYLDNPEGDFDLWTGRRLDVK